MAVAITLALHGRIAIAVTFSRGKMLAVAEGMFSFVLRVDHFAGSLAVSRDGRTRHDTSISVAQSLPVMFALAHHAPSRWSHLVIGWAWNWP